MTTSTLLQTSDGMMDVLAPEPHVCPRCRQSSQWFRLRMGSSAGITCIDQEEGAKP